MDLSLLLPILTTLGVLSFILFAVFTNNKTVGSLIQLGELQRRREVHQEIQVQKKEQLSARAASRPSLTSETPEPPKPLTTTLERISFAVGVFNACFTCYLLGAAPTQFYYWYTPKAFVLIFARWNDFRKRKQHYLLYDFCYWANALTLVYIWFYPRDPMIFQIMFLCANGPLAWAVLAFNQSLVFHKWQQITSVFIHVSPMMLSYGLRWFPSDRFLVCEDFPDCSQVSTLDMLYNTMTKFYLWWIVVYYLWIFVFLGGYLQSRSFTTLYDRVAGTQMKFLFSEKGGMIGSYHPLMKKAIYMLTHVVFGLLTMLAACVWWKFWWAHLGFMLTIASMSCYNAAKHYDMQFRHEVEFSGK